MRALVLYASLAAAAALLWGQTPAHYIYNWRDPSTYEPPPTTWEQANSGNRTAIQHLRMERSGDRAWNRLQPKCHLAKIRARSPGGKARFDDLLGLTSICNSLRYFLETVSGHSQHSGYTAKWLPLGYLTAVVLQAGTINTGDKNEAAGAADGFAVYR